MRTFCRVYPTPRGGCHTLWVLGYLAYVEYLVIDQFMLGESKPLEKYKTVFDGADVSDSESDFPPFKETLKICRQSRRETLCK